MRERWSLLLKLTAIFNLLFWLMIISGYSFRGNLIGLPTTAVVGLTAAVSLSVLLVRVRRQTSPIPTRVLAPRITLALLVCLPVVLPFLVLILLVGGFLLFFVLRFFSLLGLLTISLPAVSQSVNVLIGSLLSIIFGYPFIVLFFNWVVILVKEAVLPKPVALVTYTIQTVSLIIVLVFFITAIFGTDNYQTHCSKRYLSPSGHRSIAVEAYASFGEDFYTNRAYFDGLIFRKDLGELGYPNFVCMPEPLTLKWSADERQVDWKTSDKQGRWRF